MMIQYVNRRYQLMKNLPNTDSIRLFKADDMAAYIPH